MTSVILGVLPVVILAAALCLGPLPLAVRGALRALGGRSFMRRWAGSVGLGVAVGMLAATAFTLRFEHAVSLQTALLSLLFLLAIIDWQWRWLPIEWSGAVIALGVVFGLQSGMITTVLLQMLVPALTLFCARQAVLWVSQKEALGLGDVWFVAGLGAFLTLFESFLLIGFAALSGLLQILLMRVVSSDMPKSHAVAYGTHLCIIFVIMWNLGSLG